MVFRQDLLKGRAALITGGGTGIGRGLAVAFAAHGCDVAIVSRTAGHVTTTADEIRATGARALALTGDVRDPPAIEAAVAETATAFGRLDIVVNGAAGNFICAAEQLSPNGFGAVVDIDLKGTFNVSRAALPYLKVHGGSLVNISATLQYLATLGQVHASAAKAGVDVLTRTLAAEWGGYNVRVNGIAPGPTDETEGVRRLSTPASRAQMVAQCPLGRLTAIADVANAALFLVSDAASFITGVTLVVDGGLWSKSDRLFQQA